MFETNGLKIQEQDGASMKGPVFKLSPWAFSEKPSAETEKGVIFVCESYLYKKSYKYVYYADCEHSKYIQL